MTGFQEVYRALSPSLKKVGDTIDVQLNRINELKVKNAVKSSRRAFCQGRWLT